MSEHPADPQHWPKAAASAVVFRGAEVLIVERGKGALRGVWSLPGGHIEAGEKARDAATREVLEETGVAFDIKGIVEVHDVIFRHDHGGLRVHYVLCVFAGLWRAGEPVAARDARSARFVHPSSLQGYKLTPGIPEFVARAQGIVHVGQGNEPARR